MNESNGFEAALAKALVRYADRAPVEVDVTALLVVTRAGEVRGLASWRLTGLRPVLLLGILTALALGAAVGSRLLRAPYSGVFTPAATMSSPRAGHSATLLTDGRVLIAGGETDTGSVATAELFDPATGTFAETGPLAAARFDQEAIRLQDERILIVAGQRAVRGGSDFTDTTELYDETSGTFSPGAALSVSRGYPSVTLLEDGRVLVAGGRTDSGLDDGPSTVTASSELYDPSTGAFWPSGSMAAPRTGHSAVLLRDGRVLIIGGSGDGDSEQSTTAELYDPASGTFARTGSLPSALVRPTLTLLDDGKVLVTGGVGLSDNVLPVAASFLYDPASATFQPTSSTPSAVGGQSATLLSDGQVLLAGGDTTAGYTRSKRGSVVLSASAAAETYDPTSGTFAPTGYLAEARRDATSTRLPDDRVLVAGGRDAVVTAETEIYR